ncbi:MAG: DUF3048 domain-containing protein [Patescibacteria group bacterium]
MPAKKPTASRTKSTKPAKTTKTKPAVSKTRLVRQKKVVKVKKSLTKKPVPNLETTYLETDANFNLPDLPRLTDKKNSNRYWNWLIGFTGLALALLIISGLISVFVTVPTKQATDNQLKELTNQNTYTGPTLTAIAPLTGLPTDEVSAQRRPWAVVIENFPTVRPQNGLSFADLVIESPTEGGITRFVAIFQSQLPTGSIGPIRSARSYFNDWIRPLAPFFSHSGGSTKALQQLARGYGDIQDVNEFYNAAAYQRNNSLTAPHNLFTSAEKFFSYVQQKNWSSLQTIKPLNFTTDNQPGQPAGQIMIPYQPEEYLVTYQYLPEKKSYQRSLMGVKQTDALNNQSILVSNAVILATDIDPIPNDELKRTELRTLGKGTAWLFSQGQVYKGFWNKDKPDSYLTFIDDNEQPLPFKPGNTWISVIDESLLKEIKIDSSTPALNLE